MEVIGRFLNSGMVNSFQTINMQKGNGGTFAGAAHIRMKRIRKKFLIIIKSVLVLMGILMIALVLAWQNPKFRDLIFRCKYIWFDDYSINYSINLGKINEPVQVSFDKKIYEVLPTELYDKVGNLYYYVWDERYEFDCGDEKKVKLSWNKTKKTDCQIQIQFYEDYCLGNVETKVYFENIDWIELNANENDLIIKTGLDGNWLMSFSRRLPATGIVQRDRLLRDIKFIESDLYLSSEQSLQVRKLKDGTPMVYLDLDGDGVYEHDCSDFTMDFYYVEWIGNLKTNTLITKPELLGVYSVEEARQWMASEEFRRNYGESEKLNSNLERLNGDERIVVTYGNPVANIYNNFRNASDCAYLNFLDGKADNKIYFGATYYDGRILEPVE